jgi:DNA-binding XRE family transcriptional regulator
MVNYPTGLAEVSIQPSDTRTPELVKVLVRHVKVGTIQNWPHAEASATVTYRFPMSTCTDTRACNSLTVQKALILPHQRGDLPTCLTTLGDHIRKRRLNLGLSQREAAHIIGVEQCSVYNWEKRGMNPAQRVQSAIIDFLGYDPSQNGGASPDPSDHRTTCRAIRTDRYELHLS